MEKQKIRILSAIPTIGDTRDSKRIDMLLEKGFVVEAVAFDRRNHNARKPNCEIHILGEIQDGKYFQRVLKMIRVAPILRRQIKKNDIVYASGADMAIFSLIAGFGLKKAIILEVGDIRKIQIDNGPIGGLFRWIDKKLAEKCILLVVTSTQFITEYYNARLKTYPKFLTIENKLEEKINAEETFKDKDFLRIGYFGVLRCSWSWEILKKIALSMGEKRVEITIAGINLIGENFLLEVDNYRNINYIGKYKSPEDLPNLYSKVDIVWACYPSPYVSDKNWYWAQLICRSNRFYESCNFAKPLISIKGSGDAIEIEKHKIGLVLENQETDNIIDRIQNISVKDLFTWKKNMINLPESIYIFNTESESLSGSIRDILKNNT